MILAVDQGTTGTTCLVVDDELSVCGRAHTEIAQSYPRAGWVEHDPEELFRSVIETAERAVRDAGVAASDLRALGIANQRETTVLWERRTGRAVAPAIVWQDRRTADRCAELPAGLVRERTGLVPDPYFSASKLEWLLSSTDHPRDDLCFGTVDAWLVWRLTGGAVHSTDVTNASRTMLLGLDTLEWDDELLALFGVDRSLLPSVSPSVGVVGEADILGVELPIAGVAGDQQAALTGQGCVGPGQAKATYGTGTFVLVNAGDDTSPAPAGLLKSAAATEGHYVVEGAILVGGAAVQWLRELGVLATSAESETLAHEVESTGGVHFVPALTGLGSPQWDPHARGVISGLTRGTTRAHLARAALEAIAFQVADVVDAYGDVEVLRADGGASANAFLMQFQADILGCAVEVAAEQETTALGAAVLAGLGIGLWPDTEAAAQLLHRGARYEPQMIGAERARLRDGWQRALERALTPG